MGRYNRRGICCPLLMITVSMSVSVSLAALIAGPVAREAGDAAKVAQAAHDGGEMVAITHADGHLYDRLATIPFFNDNSFNVRIPFGDHLCHTGEYTATIGHVNMQRDGEVYFGVFLPPYRYRFSKVAPFTGRAALGVDNDTTTSAQIADDGIARDGGNSICRS